MVKVYIYTYSVVFIYVQKGKPLLVAALYWRASSVGCQDINVQLELFTVDSVGIHAQDIE